jgi:hypothetical protein
VFSVSQKTAKAPQDSIEMSTSGTINDPKERVPSRESLGSHKSASPDSQTQNEHDKDARLHTTTGEPATEQVDRSHLVANEDYSVFTVGQKRAIIFAGSFAAWFSPMVNLATPSISNDQRTSTDL